MISSYAVKKQNVVTIPIVMDKALKQMLMGLYHKESDIFELLKIAHLNLKLRKVFVLDVEIDDFENLSKSRNENERELLIYSMLNIINEIAKGYGGGLASNYGAKTFAVVIDMPEGNSELMLKSHIYKVATKIKEYLNNYLNTSVTIGISDICRGMKQIQKGYGQALNAVNFKMYLGKSRVISYSEVREFSTERISFDHKREFEFINNLNRRNISSAFSVVEAFLNEHLEKLVLPDILYMDCYELINYFYKIMNVYNSNEKSINVDNEPFHLMLQRLETLEDIKVFFFTLVRSITGDKAGNESKRFRLEISKAIEYMNENYSKDINLDMIAEYSKISKSYLCVLFKEEIGEGIIEFLNKLRVQKAKQFMSSNNYKIYEIAEAVGIPNVKYFSKVFKEFEGISPKVFKLRGGNLDILKNSQFPSNLFDFGLTQHN